MARSFGKHKMMDHSTDMLRAVMAAALQARDVGKIGEGETDPVWTTGIRLGSRGSGARRGEGAGD